jgi:hypothetical protein
MRYFPILGFWYYVAINKQTYSSRLFAIHVKKENVKQMWSEKYEVTM